MDRVESHHLSGRPLNDGQMKASVPVADRVRQGDITSLNGRGRPHVTPFPQQGYGSLGPGWLGLGVALLKVVAAGVTPRTGSLS